MKNSNSLTVSSESNNLIGKVEMKSKFMLSKLMLIAFIGLGASWNVAYGAANFTISSSPAASSGTLTICSGASVTFTVTDASSGCSVSSPAYQWKVNGANASGSSTGATYTTSSLSNYDQVTCVVMWSGGCSGSPFTSNIITMHVDPLPTAVVLGSTTGCGAVTLTAGGGSTYSWSDGSTVIGSSSALTVSSSGTYTATVTDANGCASVSSGTTVTIYPMPSIASAVSGCIACNGGKTTITVTASNGTSPYTYSGSPASNTPTTASYTNVAAGSYSYTITDANGCKATSVGVIGQPDVLSLTSASVTSPITCNGGTATVTISVAGGTGTKSYTFNGVTNTTGIFTGVVAGTGLAYSVTDANSCTPVTGTLNVSQPTIISASAVATQIACYGGTGSIALSASGGTGSLTYSWTNSATSQNLSSLAAGTYTVTVTDANNCTAASTATINPAPSAVTASAVATQIVCNGGTGSIALTASGGTGTLTFAWSNSATSQNLSGLSAGTYTVTVTDANLCAATANATLSPAPSAITVSSAAVTLPILCNGGTATVVIAATGGTGTLNYTFNGSTNTTGVFTAVSAANGMAYTVTDANSCTASGAINVTQPTALVAASSAASTVACGGTTTVTVSASGGVTPYVGTGAYTRSAGAYSYTITDANGCTSTTSGTVQASANPGMVVTATPGTIACNGGTTSVTVSATGGSGTYTSGTGIFTSVVAGTHTYTVTDNTNCSSSTTITIAEPGALDIIGSLLAGACSLNSSTVSVSVVGGTAPYSASSSFNAAGTQCTYTVTDSRGCSVTEVIQ